ncbi:hypothetical protein D3C72_522040 [compost metagenome]
MQLRDGSVSLRATHRLPVQRGVVDRLAELHVHAFELLADAFRAVEVALLLVELDLLLQRTADRHQLVDTLLQVSFFAGGAHLLGQGATGFGFQGQAGFGQLVLDLGLSRGHPHLVDAFVQLLVDARQGVGLLLVGGGRIRLDLGAPRAEQRVAAAHLAVRPCDQVAGRHARFEDGRVCRDGLRLHQVLRQGLRVGEQDLDRVAGTQEVRQIQAGRVDLHPGARELLLVFGGQPLQHLLGHLLVGAQRELCGLVVAREGGEHLVEQPEPGVLGELPQAGGRGGLCARVGITAAFDLDQAVVEALGHAGQRRDNLVGVLLLDGGASARDEVGVLLGRRAERQDLLGELVDPRQVLQLLHLGAQGRDHPLDAVERVLELLQTFGAIGGRGLHVLQATVQLVERSLRFFVRAGERGHDLLGLRQRGFDLLGTVRSVQQAQGPFLDLRVLGGLVHLVDALLEVFERDRTLLQLFQRVQHSAHLPGQRLGRAAHVQHAAEHRARVGHLAGQVCELLLQRCHVGLSLGLRHTLELGRPVGNLAAGLVVGVLHLVDDPLVLDQGFGGLVRARDPPADGGCDRGDGDTYGAAQEAQGDVPGARSGRGSHNRGARAAGAYGEARDGRRRHREARRQHAEVGDQRRDVARQLQADEGAGDEDEGVHVLRDFREHLHERAKGLAQRLHERRRLGAAEVIVQTAQSLGERLNETRLGEQQPKLEHLVPEFADLLRGRFQGLGELAAVLVAQHVSKLGEHVGRQLALLHHLAQFLRRNSGRFRHVLESARQAVAELAAQFFRLDDTLRHHLRQRGVGAAHLLH